jgi:hypothetical protein
MMIRAYSVPGKIPVQLKNRNASFFTSELLDEFDGLARLQPAQQRQPGLTDSTAEMRHMCTAWRKPPSCPDSLEKPSSGLVP